jgi:MFS family permease
MSDPVAPGDPFGEETSERPRLPLKRRRRAGAMVQRVAIDITPLRTSRDFRALWLGELVSMFGRQFTLVALPFQVFEQTHSSLAVGLIGLVQLVPLMLFSIGGGPMTDRVDRRKLIIFTEIGMALSTGLLFYAAVSHHSPLWFLYLATASTAAIGALNAPARSAATPTLVSREQLPAAVALNQLLFSISAAVGPALAGIVVGRYGLGWAYGIDVATTSAAVVGGFVLKPLRPERDPGREELPPLRAIREGFAYLRPRKVLISTFVIDLDAMIFGMPRALFPVLGLTVFKVGARGVGYLFAAPSVGALIGALTTGWVGRVRHQGRAVVIAVVLWGAAITGFGLSRTHFLLALGFLAFAGAADVVSAIFRNTILQLGVPDTLRGRISGIHIMVVTGGPRLGDFEAGVVAALVSPAFSAISGGIACIVGAVAVAAWIPELWRYHSDDAGADPTAPPTSDNL